MTTKELQLRDDLDESMTEGELPAQGSGMVPTIFPGKHLFQLPAQIAQCWEAKDMEKKDENKNVLVYPAGTVDASGADISGTPIVEQHLFLKFDRENPLVVVGGEYDGLPATAVISTMARRRGKKGDLSAPVVADMTYFVRKSLNDNTPVVKRKDWIAIVNKHAGETIRLESGLSAGCDPERIRYVSDGAGGVVEDPEGTKGCGMANGKAGGRLYSSDFKVKQVGEDGIERTVYVDQAVCKGCGAMLRGFFRIEQFLPPLGSTQTAR